jgi:hypothetical protein
MVSRADFSPEPHPLDIQVAFAAGPVLLGAAA